MFDWIAMASAYALKAEECKREIRRDAQARQFGDDQVTYNQRSVAIAKPATGKCPCCGSRQFVMHQARRVCSYCRSEQDGQPAGVPMASIESARLALSIVSASTDEIRAATRQYDDLFKTKTPA